MAKSLEELLAEIEREAKERLGKTSPAKDAGSTVHEGDATVPESEATVYEGDATVPEESAAVHETESVSPAPAAEPSYAKGEMLMDTYRIESSPIHGGMGSVWRVHHKGWDVDLAMKRPKAKLFQSERQKENFIGECKAWINLELHPNIVSCYYVREIGGVPTIFSEWMKNGSLENRIKDGSIYEGEEEEVKKRLLTIAIQFERGLKYAHRENLIHRDVKPDNLLLTENWDAKVSDFGLAQAKWSFINYEPAEENDVESFDARMTMVAGGGAYSEPYCSPEQMEKGDVTRRTDIYSWAVSVMEMYKGERPWANGLIAGRAAEMYLKELRIDLPEGLRELLIKCMAADPEERPHDFEEVDKILVSIFEDAVGTECPRPKSDAASDNADSLNNRALSYLDLGKTDEAEKLWEQAVAKDPSHVESNYNLELYKWRIGKTSNTELIKKFELYSDHLSNSFDPLIQAVKEEAGHHEFIMNTPEEDITDFRVIRSILPQQHRSKDGRRALLPLSFGREGCRLVEIDDDGSSHVLGEYLRPGENYNLLPKPYAISLDGTTVAYLGYENDDWYYKYPVIRLSCLNGSESVLKTAERLDLVTDIDEIKFTRDGDGLYLIDSSGRIMLYNLDGKLLRQTYDKMREPVHIDYDDNQIWQGRDDVGMEVIQADTLEPLYSRLVYGRQLYCEGNNLYAVENDALFIYDKKTGMCKYTFELKEYERNGYYSITGFSVQSNIIYIEVLEEEKLQNRPTGNRRKFILSYRYFEGKNRAPYLLNRIRTSADLIEEENMFTALCTEAERHIKAGETQLAFRCISEAGKIRGYENSDRLVELNEQAGQNLKRVGIRNVHHRASWEKCRAAAFTSDAGTVHVVFDRSEMITYNIRRGKETVIGKSLSNNPMCIGKEFIATLNNVWGWVIIRSLLDDSQICCFEFGPDGDTYKGTISLNLVANGTVLYAANLNGVLMFWDTSTWKCIKELDTGMHEFKAAAIKDDGTKVFLVGLEKGEDRNNERMCCRIIDLVSDKVIYNQALKLFDDKSTEWMGTGYREGRDDVTWMQAGYRKERASAAWIGDKVLLKRYLFNEKQSNDEVYHLSIIDAESGTVDRIDRELVEGDVRSIPNSDFILDCNKNTAEHVFFRPGTSYISQTYDLWHSAHEISSDGRYIITYGVKLFSAEQVDLWEIDWIYE